MILAFGVVAVAAATAASGTGYLAARASLVDAAQQASVDSVRDRINQQAPEVAYPPKQGDLERLRASLGPDVMVTFKDNTAASGSALGLVTDELRDAVAVGDGFAVQRVAEGADAELLLATPILLTGADGRQRDSGIDVYVVESLQPTEAQLDRWARVVGLTILAAIPLAVLLALLVSRSVLRPVRRLRHNANQLAAGNLSTRLEPTGRDELADLAATFNDTAAALERTVSDLRHQEAEARRFVGDVSHELRTPIMALTSIMEMVESDARGRSSEEQEMAVLAVDRTRKLARLAEDLLEVSRLDANAVTPRLEQIDVAHAVADTLRTRGWSDDVQVTGRDPVLAEVDVRSLDITVANLIGNALRHGHPPVVVDVRADGDDVVVAVTDHGPGIPDDVDPSQLFSRFYKGDASRTGSEGSGLGLSIAWANARLHGGDVTAGNTDDAGARFVVCLPRRPDGRSGDDADESDE